MVLSSIKIPAPFDYDSSDFRIHDKYTSIYGAARMFWDKTWHSSRPLDNMIPGDILRVIVTEEPPLKPFVVLYFEVSEDSFTLEHSAAKREWEKFEFRTREFAEKHNYFPHLTKNLRLIKPPKKSIDREIDLRMTNLSRDLSDESDCQKRKFGAVVTNLDDVLVGGFNHTYDNKECEPCIRLRDGIESGTRQEYCRSIHAEQDAIIKAGRWNIPLEGNMMYVTGRNKDDSEFVNDTFYCTTCSRILSQTGLKGVITHTSQGPKFRDMRQILKESYSRLKK